MTESKSEADQDERVGEETGSDLNEDAVVLVDHCAGITANHGTAKQLVVTALTRHRDRSYDDVFDTGWSSRVYIYYEIVQRTDKKTIKKTRLLCA